jgi:serine/threonine protein phosphatase 1
MENHQYVDLTKSRRVFVVGDIHGEFGKLAEALKAVNFDPECGDVLGSVGDLVDRGPNSLEFLKWIGYPWFLRVKGNHEDFAQALIEKKIKTADFEKWGGGWFVALSTDDQIRVALALNAAPLVLEIKTPGGYHIGITHADCQDSWLRQTQQLAVNNRAAILTVLMSREYWKRDNYDRSLRSDDAVIDHSEFMVGGIDHVFCGHTPVEEVFTRGNRTWIDTGACFKGGHLTLLEVDPFLDKLYKK